MSFLTWILLGCAGQALGRTHVHTANGVSLYTQSPEAMVAGAWRVYDSVMRSVEGTGDDVLARVPDARYYPISSMGGLQTWFGLERKWCAATVVDTDYLVLTGAHCIAKKGDGGHMADVVTFMRKNNEWLIHGCTGWNYWKYENWPSNDYAVVKMLTSYDYPVPLQFDEMVARNALMGQYGRWYSTFTQDEVKIVKNDGAWYYNVSKSVGNHYMSLGGPWITNLTITWYPLNPNPVGVKSVISASDGKTYSTLPYISQHNYNTLKNDINGFDYAQYWGLNATDMEKLKRETKNIENRLNRDYNLKMNI